LGRTLHDARATAARAGYCWQNVDHAGWVVTPDSPQETF
jgi:hypothetical protein